MLRDPESLRVARAIVAAESTLAAGFTTVRDLGTEGAGEADVGLRRAFEEGLFRGPRLICVTRAIVARGTYGPKGFHSGCCVPQGADEVDGPESILRATRMQIARGADWIKVYADYRFGPENEPRPTFSQDELALIVRVAHDAGVPVAAHATTAEGMRRAALAGVQTIEHGNAGTPRGVRADGGAWRGIRADARGVRGDPSDSRLVARRSGGRGEARCVRGGPRERRDDRERQRHRRLPARRERARAGAARGARHARACEALRAATSVAARVLRRDDIGAITRRRARRLACVHGDPPTTTIGALRNVRLVIKDGVVVLDNGG